jgi:hypothetical protein
MYIALIRGMDRLKAHYVREQDGQLVGAAKSYGIPVYLRHSCGI